MERYSGNQAMEAGPDWAEHGGETGLEEPMWRLGLGGGPESYPERPDEPDCIYYLRTGFCGYGNRCRFNHPHDRSTTIGALRAGGVEYPERAGQPICQYYMRTGMCKFGASCKYHHPKYGAAESSAPVALNFYGYPLRLGEKECSYYVKTGECKFGVTCKFHHPQPAEIQMSAPTPGTGRLPGPVVGPTHAIYQTTLQSHVQSSQQYGVIPGNWAAARPAMVSGSYVPGGSYGPMLFSQGVVPVPGWTPYPEYGVQASVGPAASGSTQPTVGAGPMYGLNQAYTGPYLSTTGPSSTSQKENVFPERPGQPECQYYLRTGDCKFGSTCKYHHPPEWSIPKTNFMLTPMGLPLRPGAPLCAHYAQSGLCRFGSSCKFHHPMRSSMSYSSSTSSLTNMTIAPYPIGSTNATLAPSSSSSDLRPGFIKDSFSSHMSSMNSSSASVSSVFSTSVESSAQQSGQGSISSTGGEIHTSS